MPLDSDQVSFYLLFFYFLKFCHSCLQYFLWEPDTGELVFFFLIFENRHNECWYFFFLSFIIFVFFFFSLLHSLSGQMDENFWIFRDCCVLRENPLFFLALIPSSYQKFEHAFFKIMERELCRYINVYLIPFFFFRLSLFYSPVFFFLEDPFKKGSCIFDVFGENIFTNNLIAWGKSSLTIWVYSERSHYFLNLFFLDYLRYQKVFLC